MACNVRTNLRKYWKYFSSRTSWPKQPILSIEIPSIVCEQCSRICLISGINSYIKDWRAGWTKSKSEPESESQLTSQGSWARAFRWVLSHTFWFWSEILWFRHLGVSRTLWLELVIRKLRFLFFSWEGGRDFRMASQIPYDDQRVTWTPDRNETQPSAYR